MVEFKSYPKTLQEWGFHWRFDLRRWSIGIWKTHVPGSEHYEFCVGIPIISFVIWWNAIWIRPTPELQPMQGINVTWPDDL
jgi:hypothetical protein